MIGPDEKLRGKCVYFVRDSDKPIKTTVASDESVIAGELSADILPAYEEMVSKVYYPMLCNQSDWGQIKDERERKTFLKDTSKFVDGLQRKMENLRGDIELKVPGDPYDKIEQKPAVYAKVCAEVHLTAINDGAWCDGLRNDSEFLRSHCFR